METSKVVLTKDEKKILATGLALRDQMGGHHFLQVELGGGGPILEGPKAGRVNGAWKCRDCTVGGENGVLVDPARWSEWVRFCIAVPDVVREILYRPACGVVLPREGWGAEKPGHRGGLGLLRDVEN
jgi:hypothetical protein